MAAAEPVARQNGWSKQRRPFSQWMKRLASLKEGRRGHGTHSKAKKTVTMNNNPYPESGFNRPANNKHMSDQRSFSQGTTGDSGSYVSLDEEDTSAGRRAPARSTRSAAPTVATNPETVNSEFSHSKSGTARSAGGGANSTFSSPNHSERSLTTTLTTIQSTAASGMLGQQGGNTQTNGSNTAVQFAHPYPVSPASALPPHLAPYPHSYQAATANGILTDNASILTLASSSKRRRRHSLDTDASVRALAPSSVWGGSRESLPLSVLSDRVDVASQQGRPGTNLGGYPSAERASVYSSSGNQPDRQTIPDNRSSYYASKAIDGASVRSGKFGHGRSESITGSIGGVATSPLASPTLSNPGNAGKSRLSFDRRDDTPADHDEDSD